MWSLGADNSPIDARNKAIAASVETQILDPDADGIDRAADFLRNGDLVAFGTETVYGLGADARNGQAVAQIYAVKGRPSFNPLIVHVADAAHVDELIDIPEDIRALTQFWPGPLTLVAPMRSGAGIASLVTAGLPTLAVRVPENVGARALLRAFGGPVAAPSANTSGRISPSTADHVRNDLGGRIAAILDTGPCDVGLESTIVGPGPEGPVLLRPGGVSEEDLAVVLGRPLASKTNSTINAPGQLASHYAPDVPLVMNVTEPDGRAVHIGFGGGDGAFNLSPARELGEAAANLFAVLHLANDRACMCGEAITVAPIPDHGLGQAINDRLRRAAAERG